MRIFDCFKERGYEKPLKSHCRRYPSGTSQALCGQASDIPFPDCGRIFPKPGSPGTQKKYPPIAQRTAKGQGESGGGRKKDLLRGPQDEVWLLRFAYMSTCCLIWYS